MLAKGDIQQRAGDLLISAVIVTFSALFLLSFNNPMHHDTSAPDTAPFSEKRTPNSTSPVSEPIVPPFLQKGVTR